MWKYGFASVLGTSHRKSVTPCQDASLAEVWRADNGTEILLAVVSDGAGSAQQSQSGARLACDLFCDEVKKHLAQNVDWEKLATTFVIDLIAKFQAIVAGLAETDQVKIHDFACTFLAAVVAPTQAIFWQLGDGSIVQLQPSEHAQYECVGWPQQGEYANTTNFLTDQTAAQKIAQTQITGTIDEVAIFTDGLQNLVLDFRHKTAHSPYFVPLFQWLRRREAGYSAELSAALAVYLDTEKVNARTDDDKTLLLASRL